VFLTVCHAIPVHRCAELIEALAGAKPPAGFVHGMLAQAAAAVAGANKPIRVGPGPRSRKRYLLVACTRLRTCYLLGDRTTAAFAAFVLPDLDGVIVVHDRYQNYDSFGGLIHAASTARDQGLTAVPGDIAAPLEHAFRHGVIPGPGQVPAGKAAGSSSTGPCSKRSAIATTTSCGSQLTCGSRRPRTTPNGTCGQRKPGRKSPAGSAARKLPGTGTRSAATSLPPASTAPTS